MKTMILFLFIGSLSICMSCCSFLFPDEKFSIQRADYNGNELKFDGYYYRQDTSGNTLILFLYRNGIILSTRAYPSCDLDYVENIMVDEYDKIRKDKTRWGVFIVEYDKIEYEKWTTPTESITVKKGIGYIETDTTFRITENYFSYNNKKYLVDEVYHFKQFANKPDSTNNYIK